SEPAHQRLRKVASRREQRARVGGVGEPVDASRTHLFEWRGSTIKKSRLGETGAGSSRSGAHCLQSCAIKESGQHPQRRRGDHHFLRELPPEIPREAELRGSLSVKTISTVWSSVSG